ncbi:gamma-glutamyl-gamma-aminobutyrate hydrolase family protein [Cohnella boryungensis]|uniref:Gamma-glutamyl-gamma-aminobutyrate hydrolase family protein n=1 Tax=Cohnella boryungensis TaxID=768479 RepID=A0ABV8SG75_9BACL
MKLIGVTQRTIRIEAYQETRDSLDQRWSPLLSECGLLPIALPNHAPTARRLASELPLSGFLLTGGDHLAAYGGGSPERDEVELFLLERALALNVPLLGVCRGMQVILHYYGVRLAAVEGHTASRHRVLSLEGGEPVRVKNSYHAYGTKEIAEPLRVLARAADGVVEAIGHREKRISGMMWHPERNGIPDEDDIRWIKACFDHG